MHGTDDLRSFSADRGVADQGLTVRGLTIRAGPRVLLRSLDFGVAPGQCLGLRGPSGLGKTTLLRAVAGLIDPAAGELRLRGRGPDEWGWPVWRRRVVLLQQRPVMLSGTVRDNLVLPFSLQISDRSWSEESAREALSALGLPLERVADQEARRLSVGEQQRVALVRALSLEPEVLLLDEPSSALDGESAQAVRALLTARMRRGLACLVVSHDPIWLEGLCGAVMDLRPAASEEPQP